MFKVIKIPFTYIAHSSLSRMTLSELNIVPKKIFGTVIFEKLHANNVKIFLLMNLLFLYLASIIHSVKILCIKINKRLFPGNSEN